MTMRRFPRVMAAATGIAAAVAGTVLTTGAAAAESPTLIAEEPGIQIIAQGQTADGGWVEYTGVGEIVVDGTSDGVGARAVEEVGGGIWSYGSTRNLAGRKVCYSQYQHQTAAHGSSVSMNGKEDSDWVGPGAVSSARLTEYTNATCHAYWRK
ncbi:lactococcin 972 family bacteriocin [Actinoalloteichus caeruleus]|uniref:Bacteriocin (Lactococcin_972) n=1 Tax=Actinoalloteichus caeruleus DSM 43889 TaxID=1120930 RepID=A0ABT1JEB5_ACTCY|nr:lactococcin 972 family bacteriocin [Actinoalloteichus caeruleus]MCP2330481.1 Bacteriocin (Lactococcin_972) [Actinoalloteichus caeruleus DSM 43889]